MAETHCLNCGATLAGGYCADCGQRSRPPNPTLREFADDAVAEAFSWDNKFPATLRTLLFEPGRLTAELIAGRRARWLSPLRIYLICSVAYFVSGPLTEQVTGYKQRLVEQLKVTGDSTERALLGDSVTFVNDPEVRDNAVFRAIGVARSWNLVQHPKVLQDTFAAAIPKAMFVLLPIFALLTLVAWRSTGRHYPVHLGFALHVHAAFFASAIVPILVEPVGNVPLTIVVQVALLVYLTWYAMVAFKRALGGTTGEVVARSTLVGLAYAPLVLLVTVAATVVALRAP